MEINRQLFEDVLSGKLKGTFEFRCQLTCNSDELTRTTAEYKSTYPYCIRNRSYAPNGRFDLYSKSNSDIIDFIPDTNMRKNELTIEIPEGKEIDWKESEKQNRIILKDKQLTYENVCKKLFEHKEVFYIGTDGIIYNEPYCDIEGAICQKNNATTEHQLECILAKNKLANVAKYLNDGWKPLHDSSIFLLIETKTGILAYEVANGSSASRCGSIWFKSQELAQQAIEILGEETVKLALEPLGI